MLNKDIVVPRVLRDEIGIARAEAAERRLGGAVGTRRARLIRCEVGIVWPRDSTRHRESHIRPGIDGIAELRARKEIRVALGPAHLLQRLRPGRVADASVGWKYACPR